MAQRVRSLNKYPALLCCLVIAACGHRTEPLKINVANTDFRLAAGIAQVNGKPFTGTIFQLYQNSADTQEVRNYRDGLEDGEWRKYYPHNRLAESRNYSKGFKTGRLAGWWPNGRMQQEYWFADDNYQGTCREWNADGMLLKEMNYQAGYEDGAQKAWWDNGKVKANYIVRNGRRFGLLGTKQCINVSDSIFRK